MFLVPATRPSQRILSSLHRQFDPPKSLQHLTSPREMSSIFGYSSTPTPEFEVIKKSPDYEVRKYAPQLRAVTKQESGSGPAFRTLAGYIFGGNTVKGTETNEKIAMTAPVAMSLASKGENIAMTAPVSMQGQTMSFVLPSQYKSLNDLPIPKNSAVQLIEVPATQYAVIQFSGSLNDHRSRQHEQKLREAAFKDGLALSTNPGDVQGWGYNPPWTLPWCKHNEVAIPLTTPLPASPTHATVPATAPM